MLSFAPFGAGYVVRCTQGSRPGLHSSAASRLEGAFGILGSLFNRVASH